jgi:sugar-phosphatase
MFVNVCSMELKAVIFDMDGLLVNSEPLWREAGTEMLQLFGKQLTAEQYHSSTGLRTEEWVEHWFHYFQLDMQHAGEAVQVIIGKAIEKIEANTEAFPGINQVISFFQQKQFSIGLATSSPLSLVKVVLEKLNLTDAFDAVTSAEYLELGKPHPQVFINCAEILQVFPGQCIAFEDSFNGMIAAKAARMKCVVVPAAADYDHPKWNAADAKIPALDYFTEELFSKIK